MEKLTGKGKPTVKVGNYLQTNMISKPATVKEESTNAGYWKCI